MPVAALLLTIVLLVAAFKDAAYAQGAATGGVNDRPAPTMVFPIRPRDEPPRRTAVPNRSHQHRAHDAAGRSLLIYRNRPHRR